MQIKINETLCNIPSDLSEITLSQFVSYYDKYGRNLDARLKEIIEHEYADDFDREFDLSRHEDQEAIAWISFFSGFTLDQLSSEEAVPLVTLYRKIRFLLMESEQESYVLPHTFEWQEQNWEIKDYKVTPTSNFEFNELITPKEVMRQVYSIGKGKWDGLPYLCCVFLRKIGESYTEQLIISTGERMKLFQELPMNHAMKVAFFLTVSVSIWSRALVYSRDQAATQSPHLSDIMNDGDGSIGYPVLQKRKSLIYRVAERIRLSVQRKQICIWF